MRHAVLHYDEGNALIVEECGPLMALVVHGQMGIAAAGQTDDSASRRLLGIRQIDRQFRLVLLIPVIVGGSLRP